MDEFQELRTQRRRPSLSLPAPSGRGDPAFCRRALRNPAPRAGQITGQAVF